MRLARLRATFIDKIRSFVIHSLTLLLVVSTLTAISVVNAPTATAANSGTCQQSFTSSGGTGSVDVQLDSGFCYVAFKNTGSVSTQSTFTWTPPVGVSSVSNVLIVAGGGGGGAHVGAGGGGGGLLQLTNQSISGTVLIIVGAGGRGAFTNVGGDVNQTISTPSWSTQGEPSQFGSTMAVGGGRGALWWNVETGDGIGASGNGVAGSGGSGGGAVNQISSSTSGGAGNVGQGNKGGDGGTGVVGANSYQTGGGGGASLSGGSASDIGTIKSGDGGSGSDISWLNSVSTNLVVGQRSGGITYFAGGGGGGFHNVNANNPRGVGGVGGGGDGAGPTGASTSVQGGIGLANSGGGGGGSGAPASGAYQSTGGSGGAGVVVLRYVAVPGAPTSFSATAGSGQVSLAWVAPTSNGGPVITDYLVEFSTNGIVFSTFADGTSTTTNAIVTGLTSGTTYTFKVSAINAAGTGASATVSATPLAACSPVSTSSGGFTTVTFSTVTTCSWTVPAGVSTAQVLVVGGGGGGGGRHAGGGGGGGVVYASSYLVSGTTVVQVGTGGTGGTSGGGIGGTSGTDSRLFQNGESSTGATGLTAKGGGFGDFYTLVSNNLVRAGSGGSGGGAGVSNPFTRDLTAGYTNADPRGLTIQSTQSQKQLSGTTLTSSFNQYGNDGGGGGVNGYWGGGGGGGAGAVGGSSVLSGNGSTSGSTGGAGGVGVAISIVGSAVFYGGGGGGGSWNLAGGAGGNGGGGAGTADASNAASGTANTGGGGGGGGLTTAGAGGLGGGGGSGVIIVRYANPTLTPTFGAVTATATGFTVQISNFDVGYTWSGTATESGTVAISGSGLVTVTGVAAGTSSIATITNTTGSYTGASATVSGTSTSSNVATLSALTISSGTLAPSFESGTASYTASVSNATTSVTVTPTRAQINATIQVKVGSGAYATVTSGSPSGALALSEGSNTVSALVTAQDGTTGTYTITVTRLASAVAPTIGTQPTAASKTVGQSVTFTVAATVSDGGTLSYQWQKAEANIVGATTASYTFTTSTTSDAGNYRVVVSNTKNLTTTTTTSATVALTMSSALSITTPISGLSGSVGAVFTTLNISSAGGSGTNVFAVVSGTLPAGMSLSSGGAITGTPTASGNQAITVRVTDSNTATATTASFTISIGQGSQSITFGSLINKTLGSGTYLISASSNSNLVVALTSATTAVCTISSGTITLLSVGTCTINANQAGDANFLAGTQVQQSFIVAAALLIGTPTGSALQGTYNSAFSLTLSSTGGAGTKTFAAVGSLPTGVTMSTSGVISGTPSVVGNFTITVTVTDANSATATTSSFTIVIAKGVTTVSLTIPSYTYTGSGQGPDTATASGSAGAITFAYAGRGSTIYASSSTKPTYAGLYTVTATVATDSNFASASTTANFEILAAAVAPTIGTQPIAASKTVGQSVTFTVVATASDGGVLTYQWQKSGVNISGATTASFTFTTFSTADAGNFQVIVTNTQNSTSVGTTSTAVALTMSGALTITNLITGLTGTVGISFPSLTTLSTGGSGTNVFTVASGTLPAGLSLSSGGVITGTPTASGDQAITIRVTDSNGATATTSSFTISIATGTALTPTFGTPTATADGFSVSITNYIANPSFTFAGTATASGTVTVSGAGLVTVSGVAAGTSSTATITTTRTGYSSGSATVTATTLSSIASLSGLAISSGTLSPTFASATTTYTASVSNATAAITITPTRTQANATITVNTATVASGSASGNLTLSVGANVITVIVTAQDGTTTSTYTLTVTRLATAVAPTITTQPVAASKTVGQSVTFTVVATASDSGVLSYQWQKGLVAISGATAASYTIAATVALDADDYQVVVTNTQNATTATTTSTAVALTMGKATPTFTWGNVTKTSGDATFTVTAPTVSGSLAGTFTYSSGTTSVISILGTTLTVVAAGSSVITASFIPANLIDYNTTSTTMTVTVNKAAQTVTWAPTTSYATTASPVTPSVAATALGSASITYSVTNVGTTSCSVNSITGVLIFTTAGSCTVQASAAVTSNYESATSSVIFVISLGSRTLAIDSGSYSSTYAMTATAPTLTSTASAGAGTKSYTSTATAVCTVIASTGVVTFVAIGTCTISATITADSSYSSVASSSISFAVTLATQTVSWSPTLSLLATGSPVTPSALASALGLAIITYAVQSADSSGCTVNSSTALLTFSAPGICTVRASAAATLNYAAGSTDAVFTISAVVLSIVATPSVTATAGVLKSFGVSWLSITNASSYTLKIYNAAGTTLLETVTALSATSKTITASEFAAIADVTAYQISITSIGTGNYASSSESTKATLTTAGSFLLTYSYNSATGGNGTASNSFITGATAITLPTPTKTGYTLDGWYVASDLSGIRLNSTYSPTQSLTIYAKWIADTKTITYAAGVSGSGSAPSTPLTVAYGSTFTTPVNTFTRTGYSFAGWNDGTTTYAAAATYPASGAVSVNVVLNATWSAISCSPTATTAGGYVVYTFSAAGSCFWIVPAGSAIFDLLAVAGGSGGGYSWDNTGAGGGAGGQVIITTTSLIGTLLVTVGQGGSGGTVSSTRGSSGTDTSISAVTALAGTGGCSARSTCSTATQATALAGANGGSGGSGGQPGKGGGGSSTSVSAPTGATGGTGISSNLSGSSAFYGVGGAGGTARGSSSNIPGVAANSNTGNGGGGASAANSSGNVNGGAGGSGLLIARSGSVVNYSYDANTGVGTAPASASAQGGTSFTTAANPFSKSGYAFSGWNTTTTGSGGTAFTANAANTMLISATSITLYAQWAATSQSITYALNGGTGSLPTQASVATAGTFTLAASTGITRPGYTFNGWSDGSNTYSAGATYTMGATAITLSAQWAAGSLVITFDSQGGSAVAPGGVNSGASVSAAPTAPTRVGYAFSGWSATSAGSVIAFPYAHGQTSSFTLYAIWTANTLIVSYSTYGGSAVSAGSTATAASIAIAPIAPVKANFSFTGWSVTDGGSAVTFPFAHGKVVDFTLHALWSANQYVLTYIYNAATGGNSTATANFTTGGSPVVLPTPTRTGYLFAGWFSDSLLSASIGAAGDNYSPTGSSLTPTAYSKWTPINYTVTYTATKSTSGAAPTDSTNYNKGNNVIIKGNLGSLVRTGYSFTGWTAASDGSGTLLTSGSVFLTDAANMSFYPKWSAGTFVISYNSNAASGTPTASTASYTTAGSTVTLTTVGSMVKTGFDFSGWSTTPTGSLLTGGYTTLADVTLYAIWTIKSISITFSKGDALLSSFFNFPTNRTSNYGTTVTLSDTVDSSVSIGGVNHAFVGWNDGSSVYQSGATYLLGETAPTFTAIWVKIFAVRYAFNGGTAAVSSSAVDAECLQAGNTCSDNQIITVNAAPSRVGYTFAGWVDQNNLAVIAGGSLTVTSAKYLMYANWTPVDYPISYNTAGGSAAPVVFTKRLGDTFTIATAPSRTGYNFGGWSDGTSVLGAGATYYVATSAVTLTAQWIAQIYTVIYDWNGGSGSSTADDAYTFATSSLALPLVGDHVKDGYTFAGWSTSNAGTLISGGFTPTISTTLFAIWGTGSYTLTYNANGGAVGIASASVLNGSSLILPTPTRANFVFEGWFTAASGGTNIGISGASHQPTQSRTLYAHWTQSSLYGLTPSALTRIGTTTASDSANSIFTSSNASSSVSVTVPQMSLPAGTTVNIDLVGDFTRAQSVIAGTNSYIISVVVSWLATDGTVPNTNAGKAIAVTISNASIKAGAKVYAIVAGVVALLGTATENGTVTVSLTSDPEVVVIATKPDAPTSLTATSNETAQSVISWSAPASDGGSVITVYRVIGNGGAACTTATTSCTITGLTNGTTYTFTVTATNALGTSVASNSTGATTAAAPAAPVVSGGGSPIPTSVGPTVSNRAKTSGAVTLVAPVTIIGNTDAKVFTVEIAIPTIGSALRPVIVKIDAVSDVFIAEVKVVDDKLMIKPEIGFSGKKIVTVTITENGVDRIVKIPLTVLPEAVTKPTLTPTSASQSVIRWTQSPNADAYTVLLNGKKVCATSVTSCLVNQVLGPNAVIEIISNGGNRTVSQKVEADFNQIAPIAITRLVIATKTKSALTSVDKKALDRVVTLIKSQGFSTVQISEMTTSSKTKKVADARIASIKQYIASQLGTDEVNFEISPVLSRTYFNNISVKG